ncbi:MAG: AAA family ATPase, partial [Campylobacter sp.]|nr:AAA family ATPase [Campylobacter sp.]
MFFFLGPPATGKTELAKTLKDFFDGYRFKEFSMAHYKDERDAIAKLIGSTAVWKNSAEGELTKFVKENPKSIILFDE